MYEFLTNKAVEDPPVKPKVHPKTLLSTNFVKDSDNKSLQSKTHHIFAEEIAEADEVPVIGDAKSNLKKIPHGNTKQLDKTALKQLQGIEIREVEVKAIDRNALQMRATKSMSMQKSLNEPSFVASAKVIESNNKHPYSAAYDLAGALAKPITEIFSDLVMEALNYTQKAISDLGSDLTPSHLGQYFFANIERISPDVTSAFFEYISKKIHLLSDIMLKNPHEF